MFRVEFECGNCCGGFEFETLEEAEAFIEDIGGEINITKE